MDPRDEGFVNEWTVLEERILDLLWRGYETRKQEIRGLQAVKREGRVVGWRR